MAIEMGQDSKICSSCRENKSLDLFWNNKAKHDGKYSYCVPCLIIKNKERDDRICASGFKSCSKCKQKKTIENFGENKGRARNNWCNQCRSDSNLKRRVNKSIEETGGSVHKLMRSQKYFWAYQLVRNTKNRQRLKGKHETTITADLIRNLYDSCQGICALTGLKMNTNPGTFESVSIDRIDPLKGYTPENVRVISWWANIARNRLTDDQFVKMCCLVSSHGQISGLGIK